jgi:hypothetical protein
MGREVRRVPKDWQHPRKDDGAYRPLYEGDAYQRRAERWLGIETVEQLQTIVDDEGSPPDKADYMPVWTEQEADHLMMYENTSEGTPISPAFKTPEELARWLADNNASSFARMTATYEQWLSMIHAGWAPSAVLNPHTGEMTSGVAIARAKCGIEGWCGRESGHPGPCVSSSVLIARETP